MSTFSYMYMYLFLYLKEVSLHLGETDIQYFGERVTSVLGFIGVVISISISIGLNSQNHIKFHKSCFSYFTQKLLGVGTSFSE